MLRVDILTLGLCLLGLGLSPVVFCDDHENSWEMCNQNPDKGDCVDWSVRWYYNKTLARCDRFWYGGCGGNDNNFENNDDCTGACGTSKSGTDNIVITEDDSKTNEKVSTNPTTTGVCSQPSSQGTCRNFTVKWYYNTSSEMCERFWYGGCDGNDNRFELEDECKQACITQEDVCKQPSVTGRCRARHIRWYYNSGRRECMQFVYGGCNGNGNRFRTRADCERQCLDVTEALGDQDRDCRLSRYGCCPDGRTPSLGNNNEGCGPLPCDRSEFGCCDDEVTAAQGPDQEGCELIEFPSGDGEICSETEYGCCSDGVTAAQGPNEYGCPVKTPDVTLPDNTDDGFTVDSGETTAFCQLAKNTGPCVDYTVMWYFNVRTGNCERFWYGGCEGNSNRFKSEKECQTMCQSVNRDPEPSLPVCEQSKEIGPCGAALRRWFYNSETRTCEQFLYGGCQGNDNNFEDQELCERRCGVRVVETLAKAGYCPAKPDRGGLLGACAPTCRDDSSCQGDQKCCYHGCGLKCVDPLVAKAGYCPAKPDRGGLLGACAPTCRDDSSCQGDQKCCYHGCGLKCVDPLASEPQPSLPVCEQSKEIGPCRAGLRRWFYNSETRTCEQFLYGGCQGNDNNFEDQELCERRCGVRVVETLAKAGYCPAKPDRGGLLGACAPTCRDDSSCQGDQKCCYHGCGLKCVDPLASEPQPSLPVCEQSKEIGPCRAGLRRWFYNSETRTCEQFLYGGCQGNDNNFEDQESCERRCGVVRVNETPVTPAEVCSQPADVGPCRAGITRYYYNSDSKTCQQFTYGGCGGNKNNFDTEARCRQYCRAYPPVTTATEAPKPRTRQPVCELTPALGPCRRMISKYFYNISSGQCETFTYGGCLGNHNNFETKEKCSQYCGLRMSQSSRSDDCTMSKQTGPCRGNFNRYYFDPNAGRCFEFSYGGCQGNGNNFMDENSCMATCRDRRVIGPLTRPPVVERTTAAPAPSRVFDVCSLRLQSQSCSDDVTYWYYEHNLGECREIPNGECNGNENNFRSRGQCEAYCSRQRVCQPLTYETDIRCTALFIQWTYNPTANACEEFTYGGCGGSANNFRSEEACSRKCVEQTVDPVTIAPVTRAPVPTAPEEICGLPEDSGNCLAYIRNWRYDSLTGKCVQFVYGGCGGNDNNFQTEQECQQFCNRQVVCQKFEDPEIGCLAYMRRWRYDPESGNCENFIYGGCGGNANNFESLEACDEKCSAEEPEPDRGTNTVRSSWRDICNLQADVGPCKQFNKRWHYNSISQSCEEFTYGGCLGNHNNFESEAQCMTYCDSSRWSRPDRRPPTTQSPVTTEDFIDESSGEVTTVEPAFGVDACALESYTGRCRAYIRSWYYDSLSGQCKQFIFGGCDSNGNRFDSQQECESQCSPRAVCMLPKRSGACMAYITRYYYDYDAQTCKEFVYGGCDGNANNFETMQACEQRCSSLLGDISPPDVWKQGRCPAMRSPRRGEVCYNQCRRDRDCPGRKKCCVLACSYVCIEPEYRVWIRPAVKRGYCPPRTDWGGLLGACAPTCRDDTSCQGDQKCCYHGCGLKCVDPVAEEPYQMTTPERVRAISLSGESMMVTWQDRSLGSDQRIRDNRYYTIRYYTFRLGQYEYRNVTELRAEIDGLKPDTEYKFSVRVNDPPYLSEWSDEAENRTQSARVLYKSGQCPVVDKDTFGICLEECQNDYDCDGAQKCCSNGCGQTCVSPYGYNRCRLPKDPGSCSDWEPRWYYDNEAQRCDRFWYGGCNEGNENNFMEQSECQAACDIRAQVTTTARPLTARPYDCRRTTFGCCLDRYTPRLDESGTNCLEYVRVNETRTERIVPVIPGESATLDCRYGGDVSWYRDGKLVESDERHTITSDGTFVVINTNIEDDGLYACHVRISGGRPTVYSFMLQVRVPIGIIPGPEKIMVKPNRQAFLHCEVYGNPKPSVTWMKGNTPVTSDYRYETFRNGTLLIRSATERDIDSYTCTADNGVTSPVQRTVKLELREMLVARIENDNGRVMEGARIKLSCEGRGYPPPTITWEKMGRPLSTDGNVFISSDGQLTIRNVTTSDTGTYTCIVSNSEEKIETATSVQVVRKVMPDDKCVDKTSLMKCRLIVTARLCGYPMYSRICCESCRRHLNGA